MVGVGRVGETFDGGRRGEGMEMAGDLSGRDGEGDEPGG